MGSGCAVAGTAGEPVLDRRTHVAGCGGVAGCHGSSLPVPVMRAGEDIVGAMAGVAGQRGGSPGRGSGGAVTVGSGAGRRAAVECAADGGGEVDVRLTV